MTDIRPLVFKDYKSYLYFLQENHEVHDGIYDKLVIYHSKEAYGMSRILLHRYEILNGELLFRGWLWSIYNREDEFIYSANKVYVTLEVFFEFLKNNYADYFAWLLFNPEWYNEIPIEYKKMEK